MLASCPNNFILDIYLDIYVSVHHVTIYKNDQQDATV